MKVVSALLVLLLSAGLARAQPVSGFYVQGSAGLTLPQQQSIGLPSAQPDAGGTSAAATAEAAIDGKADAAESGAAGWGNGHGLRMEIEGFHTTQSGGATD